MKYIGNVKGYYKEWKKIEGREGILEEEVERKDKWKLRKVMVR